MRAGTYTCTQAPESIDGYTSHLHIAVLLQGSPESVLEMQASTRDGEGCKVLRMDRVEKQWQTGLWVWLGHWGRAKEGSL